jgi:hypothetical protein
MEVLLILGLLAVAFFAGWGVLGFLRQRREGTVLAVTVPVRSIGGRHNRTTGRASSAHK